MWIQNFINLRPMKRGFHLITDEIYNQMPQIHQCTTGILHLFVQHTSASLTVNENADPTVRQDMETHFCRTIPEGAEHYLHNYEGDDDMPAHIKASLLGSSVTLPVTNGRLTMGTWQGVYLGEHRDHGGARKIVATLNGNIDNN